MDDVVPGRIPGIWTCEVSVFSRMLGRSWYGNADFKYERGVKRVTDRRAVRCIN